MLRRLNQIGFALITVLAIWLLYRFTKSQVETDLYRDKLTTLRADYESLRTNFNQAVKKTAVTELMVANDGSISVVFVNLDGSECVVATPFKMGAVVYVDYVVVDDRIMLRQVFDSKTAPDNALVINRDLQTVNWEDKRTQGTAIFRKLDQPGRWIVTVSGEGAFRITRRDEKEKREPLVAAPPVKEYSQVEKELSAKIDEIGFGDVFNALFGKAKK